MSRSPRRLAALAFVLGFSACGGHSDAYAPGLGEIMTLQQMRHAKLWFAGRAGNWELAAYETDELEEGFADAIHYHPTHKSVPQPLGEMIPRYIDPAVAGLRAAIEARDEARFEPAFAVLTSSCNGCHMASGFGFNVVVRPKVDTFANQDFSAPK